MTQFYLGFFLWPVYIATCMVYNYVKIDKWKVHPRYFVSNQWRVFFGFVFLILMTIQDGFDPAYLLTWIPAIPPMIYIICSFYLFFDAGLNGLRAKKIDYRGKASGIFDTAGIVFYYTMKAVCLAGLVWSLIVIL